MRLREKCLTLENMDLSCLQQEVYYGKLLHALVAHPCTVVSLRAINRRPKRRRAGRGRFPHLFSSFERMSMFLIRASKRCSSCPCFGGTACARRGRGLLHIRRICRREEFLRVRKGLVLS